MVLKNFMIFLTAVGVCVLHSSDEIRLDEIKVIAKNISSKKSILNKNDIKKGQIFSEKDLVRNETGVSITEGGRAGNNGFAIRGVDSDRVSLKVDGIEAAQSFMPVFYYQKGLMNGNRNSTELENLSSIEITKGANSLTKGSGAIGGSVSMRTKEVADFVSEKEIFGLYSKSGFASINNEFRQVSGAGLRYNGFEALFQHTYKKGRENKNYFSGKISDIAHCGMGVDGKNYSILYPNLCSFGRILPDNVKYTSNSNLAKFGYRFDEHFINTFYEDLSQKYFTEQKSNSVASASRRNFNEKIPYKRYGIYYEFSPTNDEILSYFKTSLVKQKVTQSSQSNQYKALSGTYAKQNNELDIYRKYEIYQDKISLDIEAISSELGGHILSFGAGASKDEFKNKNLQIDYFNKKSENFTYQQPVKSTLLYAYLKDDLMINDNFGLNFGIRADKYKYSPKISELRYENSYQEVQNLKPSKFNALTYEAGFEYALDDSTAINYAFSTGFRAPKVEEMYFVMNGSGKIKYYNNLNLKPEKAQNHELSISQNTSNYAFELSAFYTKYKDFIDMQYEISTEKIGFYIPRWTLKELAYKQNNIDTAKVKGIEINARANADLINLPSEYFATFKATYQKGNKSDGTSLLALDPFSAILGIGYSGEKFDMLLSSKFTAAKKAKDAKDKLFPNSLQISIDPKTGEITNPPKTESHPYLSNSYTIFDLTAGYKISKNFSIYAGVFNIFDKKYSTWQSLRQLRYNGNQGYVLNKNTQGLDRYTAAGRNFSLSFEMRY